MREALRHVEGSDTFHLARLMAFPACKGGLWDLQFATRFKMG